ncbi:hypothetical protein EW026_g1121 [Hermanssonia centrifuga]|uniref:Uncharacterized protein n=1 Tax=Hermanssonia centrifuga TaxID=98765 RepID=A0A4S4KU93_9APHY|nr:hypothetical protein EW026_g1121 [Hermanssonia centrifuga]
MSSTMEDLGYLTCLCLLDLYHPLELTAVTMHDDHFHILDNTSTNPENDAVPELTVDALEVIELAVIVIP